MSQAGDLESEFGGDTSINFWEPKQYAKTVKRYENSHKLCQDLSVLILERSEIEKQYSTNLSKWYQKWTKYLETGPEYGTSKYGWTSFLKEGNDLSDVHVEIRNKLTDEVQNEVKVWQKEHFHKVNLPVQNYKEVKALESEFEYAQKTWNKRLKRVSTCKKDFHAACKQEKSLYVAVTNSKNDSTVAADQIKKLEDKYKKAEKEVEKTKASYEAALQDLESDSTRYMEEMEKIFKKAQEYEDERMGFFKSIFRKIRDVTNLANKQELQRIYDEFNCSINEMNSDVDLKNWSISFGASMLFQIPQFEEYSPELTSISQKKVVSNSTNVTLKSVTQHDADGIYRQSSVISKPMESVLQSDNSMKVPKPQPRQNQHYDEALNPFGTSDEVVPPNGVALPTLNQQNTSNDTNYYDQVMLDDNRPGVKVRALYDYKKQDSDEISLTAGMEFEKIEDEDQQGWCKGRVNGVIGLYPANYAEPV